MGALPDEPCHDHQADETEAGQHQDIRFGVEPARCLDMEEKAGDIIDQMGEDRRPQATCPVVQVAEDESADRGRDQQGDGFRDGLA